ncbi:MAG: spore cortex-lytic enzyme [Tissierellaceae bacterium]|nr:spore cortex-lytic enzyme [Tissierellaceae bacterium]
MKKFIIITTALTMIFLSIFLFFGPENPKLISSNYTVFAERVLYWGTQGQDVKTVQDKLSRWGFYDGKADGIYGARTYRAVRKFQAKHGLKVDGVVGLATARALGLPHAVGATASGGVNRSADEYLLARAIHGEARGEPYVGKVAVAAVVLNRTRSSSFPNTIAGVIYQPLAFTAVADGQINLTPNMDSIKAARDALNGWDPTYGCLYYWNPATATSKWIWSRKVTLKIGKHWFGI